MRGSWLTAGAVQVCTLLRREGLQATEMLKDGEGNTSHESAIICLQPDFIGH